MPTFIGVDLGWYGKPSGLAAITLRDTELHLIDVTRIEGQPDILAWIERHQATVVAVDAPLVIPNATGIRPAERDVNRDFRRFHAGCHAANTGRPFAAGVTAFSRELQLRGFAHGAAIQPRRAGRFQIEVHPHAASVRLFGLDRIVKYKRGRRADRARELERFRALLLHHLPVQLNLPQVPSSGSLKPVEDMLDAVLCAYIAAHYWIWGAERNTVYGDHEDGYIVVPGRSSDPRTTLAE